VKDANIILLGIDTLRYDHLGYTGYSRPTSPHIDALASKSMVFRNCFSQSYSTAPSFMSLMTSLYPTFHGVLSNISMNGRAWRLDPKAKTLGELLQSHGYKTAAFTENAMILPEIGFARGFEIFETKAHTLLKPKEHPLLQWLSGNPSDKFFAFFHTYAVHAPYMPPKPYNALYTGDYAGKLPKSLQELRESKMGIFGMMQEYKEYPTEMQYLRDLYDGAITYLDAFIGFLIELLEEKHLIDNTIIVLVSDHGEEFMEHGGLYHSTFYDEILHVPLIIYTPFGQNMRSIEQIVRIIDVAPTLLDLIGVEQHESFQGRSLVDAAENEFNLVAPAEYHYRSALRTRHFKYIFTPYVSGRKYETELYNISLDPKETNDMGFLSTELIEQCHRDLDDELRRKGLPRPPHQLFHVQRHSVQSIKLGIT
jgi:arylsulfatase A-like enzyme